MVLFHGSISFPFPLWIALPRLRPTEWNGGCLYTVALHRRDMSFGQTLRWSSGCTLELWRAGPNLLRLKKLLVKSMSELLRNIPTRRGASAGKAMLDWSPVSQKLIFPKNTFYLWMVEAATATCIPNQAHSYFPGPRNTNLRWPRNYPEGFGRKLASLYDDLNKEKLGVPSPPQDIPSAEESFAEMEFSDIWQDAEMVSVCHWLRGGRDLEIPESFRSLLPKKLWSSNPSW